MEQARTFYLDKEEFEVVFTSYPKVVDIGIGSYEYFGYKGNDSQLVISCEDSDFTWDNSLHTDEQNLFIEKWLEDDRNWGDLEDQFIQAYEPED